MKLNLNDIATSPQELKTVISEVRKYARWFGQNAVKKRVSGTAPDALAVISQSAASLIRESASEKPLSSASLDELIVALEKLVSSLPCVTITLAAPVTQTLKKTLTTWFREQVRPDILVDFRFNSTILGGMVVQYGSHIYDWSFRRQILAARQKFPEVLRHV